MYPTADQIAHAIVAACRITGADPVAVASRETDRPSAAPVLFPIARARSYAALAIQAFFPALPRAAVDRVVGCTPSSIGMFVGSLNRRIKDGGCTSWYDPERLLGVVNAIPKAIARAPAIPEIRQKPSTTRAGPASPLPRPIRHPAPKPSEFTRFGAKKRLEDELRQAVLNTGGKPV